MVLLASLLVSSPAVAGTTADRVAAVVGEQVILASELDQAVDFLRLADPDTTRNDSVLRTEVLQRMVDDLLLQEQAKKETIEVTNAEAQAEVAASIAALIERFGSEDKFREALAQEGLTERALRQRYADDARRKLIARRLMDREGLTQIYISPTEAERFYDEHRDSIAFVPGRVRLAHILIPVTPAPGSESLGQRRMAEVLDVLSRGGDFAVVAGSFSEDPKTATKGGDWGWVRFSGLAPEIRMVLDQLKPGQVSPPFRTLDGYLTLRLESRTTDRVRFSSILIRVPIVRADTTRARSEAEALRAKAAAGAPFDSLARKHSGDPVTADSGGYLGEFLVASLTPPFDQVVAALDSGQVSEPVLSDHGFHIIKVLARQPERYLTYLEMQDGIRNYLYQQRLAERLQTYVGRIASRVFVRRYD
jgi:peptidyl-prolyl cis-trans isomerase SurA